MSGLVLVLVLHKSQFWFTKYYNRVSVNQLKYIYIYILIDKHHQYIEQKSIHEVYKAKADKQRRERAKNNNPKNLSTLQTDQKELEIEPAKERSNPR